MDCLYDFRIYGEEKMKTQTIFRILKAGLFILALIFYGLTSGILSTFLFAIVLALYLIELYKERKNE